MAESLRRLVKTGSFSLLQEKLERWNDSYLVNTSDQNVNRCCDLIELTSRLQGQLFMLLNLTSAEGGTYGGCDSLKNRLLPWLSQGFAASTKSVTSDTSLSIMADAADKERQLVEVQDDYERQLENLEQDLNTSRGVTDELRIELDDTRARLNDERQVSVGEALISADEANLLREKISSMEDELLEYKTRQGTLQDYEVETRRLRDDVLSLREEKAILTGRTEYLNTSLPASTSPRHAKSASNDVVQRIRQAHLVTRFSDMFARDRMDAMDILRNHCDDHELNQKIVFTCVQEAFHAARKAFRQYRTKVRSTLTLTHVGPDTLEESVQQYINKNGQLLDVHSIVQDVLLAMNTHPTIAFPAEVDFRVLTLFIRELVKVSWSMSALPLSLDIATARMGELYDENRYRRSYDSEYSAPLVAHYIWPALLDSNNRVLLKGEAVTRRGASMGSPRRSRSPSRAMSPRSRSPSPRRMDGAFSPSVSRGYSPRPGSAASSFTSY
ncbi:mitochondria-eating protein-like isoform X1 [Amphiura filiformis]|uniref:mitochondria-eating protein-like isoform X1 n=1 Tax=Amphiura filiformis TaxID=82378 RepID=UPI003B226A98